MIMSPMENRAQLPTGRAQIDFWEQFGTGYWNSLMSGNAQNEIKTVVSIKYPSELLIKSRTTPKVLWHQVSPFTTANSY
jgi:hypothetical protein